MVRHASTLATLGGIMLKKASIASSVLALSLALSSHALAADLNGPSYAGSMKDDFTAPEQFEPASDRFCDFYTGVQAGYVWDTTKYSGLQTGYDQYLEQGKNDGVLGGLYAGCNFRRDAFLWGVEGDVNLVGVGYGDSWYSTLRGRAGATLGDTLLYATGGLAFGKVDMFSGHHMLQHSLNVDTPTAVGWTLGGGIEHWFSKKVSWKVEYLYMDLGKVSTLKGFLPDDIDADWRAHTVRTGVAVHW